MSNLRYVREATADDSAIIYRFILEHAREEALGENVTATQEDIENNIFKEKMAHVLLIENEVHAIVGYAIYFFAFSAFSANKVLYLEDLYVLKNYRRGGFGKALMHKLARLTLDKGCTRMQWLCPRENLSALAFYKTWGAKFFENYSICRLEYDTLNGVADF